MQFTNVVHPELGPGKLLQTYMGGYEWEVAFDSGRHFRVPAREFTIESGSVRQVWIPGVTSRFALRIPVLEPDQFRARQALETLRLGIVPVQDVEMLAIGLEVERVSLNRALARSKESGDVLAVIGDYGFDKRPFVELAARRALRENFLVTVASLDLMGTSLSKTSELYSVLVRSIRYPDTNKHGLRPLFQKAHDRPTVISEFMSWVPRREICPLSATLEALTDCGSHQAYDDIVQWISGQILPTAEMKTCLPKPPRLYRRGEVARQYAYLLAAISVLATLLGYSGLAVLVDESEHYSLTHANQLEGVDAFFRALIYIAMGPLNSRINLLDIPSHPSVDYEIAFASGSHLFFLFALTQNKYAIPIDTWLAPSQIVQVDDRIIERDIQTFFTTLLLYHSIAYGYEYPPPLERYEEVMKVVPGLLSRALNQHHINLRDLIRLVTNILDLLYLYPGYTPEELLHELELGLSGMRREDTAELATPLSADRPTKNQKWTQVYGELPKRFVNICIVSREIQIIIPKTASLGINTDYYVRVDISGLSADGIENDNKYPASSEPILKAEIGYWLEVFVVSEDFITPKGHHYLFLPKSGASWICTCPPEGTHTCDEETRKQFLFIPFKTMKISENAQLRIAIYYRKNLIQSQLLTAEVTEVEEKGEGYYFWIDYSLTANFQDINNFPSRTLNILTNQNANGTHRIVFNGRSNDIFAFNLTEGQIRGMVGAMRQALRDVHMEEIVTLLRGKQIRNLYDEYNAKTKEEFISDLKLLAPLGWRLWTSLLSDQPVARRELRTILREPSKIQVSRVRKNTFVLPWALIYDIPLLSDSKKHRFCRLLEDWDSAKDLLTGSVARCPYENEHGNMNTICPFGFWGFKHTIEHPPSLPENKSLCQFIYQTNNPPELIAGLNLTMDNTTSHLNSIRSRLTRVTILNQHSLAEITRTLAGAVEIVYFYCHGRRELLPGTSEPIPYLELAEGERITPDDIIAWSDAEWSEDHWEDTSPLVFINGCHTTELTPESLVNFVDVFVGVHAAGVIGTEISVHQKVASEAAEEFFSFFQNNENVGQAMQHMRLHFLLKGNLLGLAYTPYCSSDLVLAHMGK